jgi:hypothetical protein
MDYFYLTLVTGLQQRAVALSLLAVARQGFGDARAGRIPPRWRTWRMFVRVRSIAGTKNHRFRTGCCYP